MAALYQNAAQAGFWYSAAMALYFLGVIRYSLNDRTIARYEKIFHVVTFVILETFAVSVIFFDAYNPCPFYTSPSPPYYAEPRIPSSA